MFQNNQHEPQRTCCSNQTLSTMHGLLGCGCHGQYWTELLFRNGGISLCFYPKTALVLQCCASHIPPGPQSIPQAAVGKAVRPLWVWRHPRSHRDKKEPLSCDAVMWLSRNRSPVKRRGKGVTEDFHQVIQYNDIWGIPVCILYVYVWFHEAMKYQFPIFCPAAKKWFVSKTI